MLIANSKTKECSVLATIGGIAVSVHGLDKCITETHISSVTTRFSRSQVRKMTPKLMSRFHLHENPLALSSGDVDSCCEKSVKTFSHLSCHELSKAWRERESGDEQGDKGGIDQASDGKGRAAGSLIALSVVCIFTSVMVKTTKGHAKNVSVFLVRILRIILGAPFFDNGAAIRTHILTFSTRIC